MTTKVELDESLFRLMIEDGKRIAMDRLGVPYSKSKSFKITSEQMKEVAEQTIMEGKFDPFKITVQDLTPEDTFYVACNMIERVGDWTSDDSESEQ